MLHREATCGQGTTQRSRAEQPKMPRRVKREPILASPPEPETFDIRGLEVEPSARAQQARHLAQSADRLGKVFEHVAHVYEVKAPLLDWRLLQRADVHCDPE